MRLDDLTKTRDEAQKELDIHRRALATERLNPLAKSADRRRLHEAIDACTRAVEQLDEDIEFEQGRIAEESKQARLTAARQKRDRALKTHDADVSKRWLAIAELLRQATAEAAALSTIAQQVAADATAAVWFHHAGATSDTSRDHAGRVTTLALGDELHAHALTCLIRDLVNALPASLPPRLSQRYFEFNHSSLSGVPVTTMEAATSTAHEQLRARLTPLLS